MILRQTFMDQPAASANPLTSALPGINSMNLPSVKELLQTAWSNVKKNLLLLFIYNTVGLVAYFLTTLIFMGLILSTTGLQSNQTVFGILTLSLSVLYLAGMSLVSGAILVINTILLSDAKNPPFLSMLRYSVKKTLSLLLILGLAAFFITGGLFLLIIPGVLLALFFIFAPFISILENQGPVASLKRSAFLVSRSFGDVFIRLAILLLIPLLVSIVMDSFSGGETAALIVGFLGILFNIIYTWFAISYLLILYKQTKQGADVQGQMRLRPVILVGVAGWIVGAVLIGLINFYNSNVSNNISTLPDFNFTETAPLLEDELLFTPPSATESASTTPSPRASSPSRSATSSASPN